MTAEIKWLQDYKGTFPFWLSLKEQLERKGSLSPKQLDCVTRAIARENQRAAEPPPEVNARTLKAGEGLEIRAWLARSIATEYHIADQINGEQLAFRNLEIVEVLRETERAWQVKFRYVSKICNACHLCGKELDTDVSRACGIGPTCAKKLGFKRATLNDAQAILKKLEDIATKLGVIGPRWLPKSQACGRFNPAAPEVEEDYGDPERSAEEMDYFYLRNRGRNE